MQGRKPTLVIATAIGLLAGLAAGVTAQAEDVPATASAGCDQPLIEPGDHKGTNDAGDAGQEYWVVVPERYAELAPVPLFLDVAGGFGEADSDYEYWRPYLDETESLFVVAGTEKGAVPTSTLLALIDQLSADYCIDSRRIHAMGASSSAPTVTRLACEASDRIASFVSAIGGFRILCEPERPVPLLAFTGDPDRVFTSSSVRWWAEMAGCEAETLDSRSHAQKCSLGWPNGALMGASTRL